MLPSFYFSPSQVSLIFSPVSTPSGADKHTGICWTYRSRGVWASSSANSKWISGPKGRPFKGNLQELDTNGAASCKAWYSLYERYGPAYEMTVPFFRMHVINHPRYLEHIQKHNSKNYIRGLFTRNTFGQLHRTGVFVADGKEWHLQRKAATRAFSKNNFETHITQSVHHWLDILMRLLSNLAKKQEEFDFQELMSRLMFCLFLQIAFHEDRLARDILSEDPECLKSKPDYVEAFDQATHRELLSFDREAPPRLQLMCLCGSVRPKETGSSVENH